MGSGLTFSFIVIFFALSEYTSSAQQCTHIKDSVFRACSVAGYNKTFRVPFELSNKTKIWIDKYLSWIVKLPKKNCSVALMGEIILCSVYAPSCTEGNPNPNLPCRRVCSEFVKRCHGNVDPFWLEYFVGLCTLLPNKTASSGQCFEPPGFEKFYNASTKGVLEDKCSRLVIPWCKGIGYEYTIIKESTQITAYNDIYSKNFTNSTKNVVASKDSEVGFWNEIIANNSKCSTDIKKLICSDLFPPCFPEEGLAFYTICKSICEDMSKRCPGIKLVESWELYFQFCEGKAFGVSSHGFCKLTTWPKPNEWVHFYGDRRRSKVPPGSPNKGFTTQVIAAVVIVPLIVIGLVVVGVVLWRQRKLPWLIRFFKRADDTKGFVKEEQQ